MEHESFENDDIARVLNEHFVSIKVDREERPDLDQIYMMAVQRMNQGQGGWPMSVFLTPQLQPFYGGTYYPPDDRYGRPGFRRLLLLLADAWKERRADINNVAQDAAEFLRQAGGLPRHGTCNRVERSSTMVPQRVSLKWTSGRPGLGIASCRSAIARAGGRRCWRLRCRRAPTRQWPPFP